MLVIRILMVWIVEIELNTFHIEIDCDNKIIARSIDCARTSILLLAFPLIYKFNREKKMQSISIKIKFENMKLM